MDADSISRRRNTSQSGLNDLNLGTPTASSFNDIELKKRFLMISDYVNFERTKCIDVGRGNGFYTVLMARQAGLVVVIDLQRNFLRYAKDLVMHNKGASFLRMSADVTSSLKFL